MRPQTMAPVRDSGGKELSFGWPAEPGQSFLLQIAHDAGFKDLYLEKQLLQPGLSIPRPEPGTYYIRVRATDADGYVGAFSATQKLNIFSRWTSSDGQPVDTSGGPARNGF
jgi:hypothetical protein